MSNDQWPAPAGGYDGSQPGGPGDSFADFDSFGAEYKPESSFRLGLESLADGPYDMEVQTAVLEMTKQTNQRICRIGLRILGGRAVEWAVFLTDQRGLNGFCADLALLGFDAHLWNTPGRPLSKEVPAAVAKLPGIKFRAVKRTERGKCTAHQKYDCPACVGLPEAAGGKHFHKLLISCKIDGRPMPPLQLPASSVPNNGAPQGRVSVPNDDSLPF